MMPRAFLPASLLHSVPPANLAIPLVGPKAHPLLPTLRLSYAYSPTAGARGERAIENGLPFIDMNDNTARVEWNGGTRLVSKGGINGVFRLVSCVCAYLLTYVMDGVCNIIHID